MGLWFDEIYDDMMRFGLRVEETLYSATSPFQKIDVVKTTKHGRALLLDELWMTSEGDEFYYHEMIVHPALTTVPRIARVLVIGGGDGGTVREVLSYPEVEECVLVEIDGLVVEACQKHLPTIGTAWNDPRLKVVIEDAIAWVKEPGRGLFDVILVDGSDPVGPAEGLFGVPFYEACRAILEPHGVLVTQSESPVIYRETHIRAVQRLESVFGHAHPYYSVVPIYNGGEWSWTYASANTSPFDIIEARAARAEERTRLYNREYHRGAFAIPNRIKKELGR